MNESLKDRAIRWIQEMRNRTVDRGATPAEAAAFAAKISELMEKYQIGEAEARAKDNPESSPTDFEVCQNKLRTGKKAFNPGMTAVVCGLAQGMCCKVIQLHEGGEAIYGIVGETMDCDYVCQIAITLVPSLRVMANLEGAEHGHEKAGLVRWSNQYLIGAAEEILKRIEKERKERSEAKKLEAAASCRALAIITGDSLAVIKREATAVAFKDLYPRTIKIKSDTQYDPTANQRGREAGKSVGLNVALEGGA